MRVAVSACLLGRNCKYNGGNNLHEALAGALDASGCAAIPVCPEVAGGLPVPRPRSELLEGAVVDEFGSSVDAAFRSGAAAELARIDALGGCDVAILQPRSPSCGAGRIYDGTFSGVLVPGDGVFAALLKERGIPVLAPDAFVRQVGSRTAASRGAEHSREGEATMANENLNPIEAFGLHIAHIGVNATDEADAQRIAALIEALFGLEQRDTPISVFSGELIEVMKGCGRGVKGHIGLAVNDLPAAEAYFCGRGLTLNEDSRALNPDGSTKLVYFNEDIAGFAVHLCCE